ncbi:hypothetical protein Syun_024087 [Stephania yunnanensis]|uniref:Uncharacterized protein n=1 Tax=Stephania yunnanensis TaxID=152371 RepID=A0AAP0I3P6_9MAGN
MTIPVAITGSAGLGTADQYLTGSKASVVGDVSSHLDVAVWGPPFVKLTRLGTLRELMEATGKWLSNFAGTLGLPFEFLLVYGSLG